MFLAYEIGLDVIRQLRWIVPVIARHDADLAKQMKRAANSVTHNLNEGRKRRGQDRIHHYAIAAGSASEVLAGLDNAEAWGYPVNSAAARQRLDHLMAILWKLTNGSGGARAS